MYTCNTCVLAGTALLSTCLRSSSQAFVKSGVAIPPICIGEACGVACDGCQDRTDDVRTSGIALSNVATSARLTIVPTIDVCHDDPHPTHVGEHHSLSWRQLLANMCRVYVKPANTHEIPDVHIAITTRWSCTGVSMCLFIGLDSWPENDVMNGDTAESPPVQGYHLFRMYLCNWNAVQGSIRRELTYHYLIQTTCTFKMPVKQCKMPCWLYGYLNTKLTFWTGRWCRPRSTRITCSNM